MDGPDIIAMVLINGMQEKSVRGEGNMMTKAEIGVMHFGDGGGGHKPMNTGGLRS